MVILLTGATGFIGHHLALALRVAGHRVRCAVRDPDGARRALPGFDLAAVDFTAATSAGQWRDALRDVDAVVNAVGIFREDGAQRFDTLHTRAPIALFDACVKYGVRRVIQISAHGAQTQTGVAFLDSKRVADQFLLEQPLVAAVLMPAPVFGAGGASARLFLQLASLPVIGLPGGVQTLQPVHIDDVCSAVLQLLRNDTRGRIAAVGPQALTVREYLAALRAAMGYRPAMVVTVPPKLIRLAHAVLRSDWLDPDTLNMLARSRPADTAPFTQLLARTPLAARHFLDDAQQRRREIWLAPALRLLRASLALLWIVTGIVSLWVYPRADSLDLLARSGFGGAIGLPLLIFAATLNMALGFGIIWLKRGRALLWLAQAVVIVGYTLIITLRLPEFWAHPYGPILKNVPLLAAIALLYACEPPTGSARR